MDADEPPSCRRPTAPTGNPPPANSSPNRAYLHVALAVLVLPHHFPTTGNFTSTMTAPFRNYIAITKFFLGSFLLDPGTYLRELELTFVFKRLSIVKSI
jgi:hypothetical protein